MIFNQVVAENAAMLNFINKNFEQIQLKAYKYTCLLYIIK